MAQASVFKGSTGINNALEPHRLRYLENGFCPFAEGVNIVIDDGGSFARRKGVSQVFDGPSHSLWAEDGYCFFVSEGDLYRRLADDTNVLVLGGVGDAPMYYAVMHDKCYMANGTVRLIVDDSSVSSWTLNAPTQMPGDTRVFGLPTGFTRLLVHAGRMLVVTEDKFLWESLPGNPRCFVLSDGPLKISGIKDFASVKTGIYVACADGMAFLQGTSKIDMQYEVVHSAEVVEGTVKLINGEDIEDGIQYLKQCVIWVSRTGICVGDQRGVVHNKTSKSVVFDKPVSGAAVVLPGQYFFSLEVE